MSTTSSTPPNPSPPTQPPDPTQKVKNNPVFTSILNELNVNQDQLNKRQKLIARIEAALTAKYGAQNRLVSYILRFGHARTVMHVADIPNIETILNSVSGAEQINVLLHTPGGDGTIIEKMVEICRAHLSGKNQKLRVIVPNLAKSAGTILAMGADQIVMGYCSELGPIDPQVPISVSGMTQWVSAFAFVEARDKLMVQIAEATKKKEPTVGLLQQLAGLNIPFTDEMENHIEFSRKTAVTLLDKYMLKPDIADAKAREKKASEIAKQLLSKQLFPVHGHYIDAGTAKNMGLHVELLDRNDELWQLIWSYHIRCEVQMNLTLQQGLVKTKLFESGANVSLVTQDAP
jgi:ClpP class serine protease